MPIYAYRCSACGHAQDVLQKMSDPLLTQCPACGADAYVKQVTAAGFQLKGSGWYVTDFRGGNNGAKKEGKEGKEDSPADAVTKADDKVEDKRADKAAEGGDNKAVKPADKGVSGAADPKPADKAAAPKPAPAPAAGPPPPPTSSGS
jgi:putative FmdB family regulatory protein